MAIGIVSTALFIYEHFWLSDLLMAVAVGLYILLWLVYLERVLRAPRKIWQDLTNPATTFGFFTIVAGSNGLGVRFLFHHWVLAAKILGTVGILSWTMLFYTAMTVLIAGPAVKKSVVNGGWLIAMIDVDPLGPWGLPSTLSLLDS